MKSKILTALLMSGLFCAFAQDNNKPTTGDIGIHYGVNFNGAIQQNLAISGIISKSLELGGVLSFSYSHTNTSSNTLGTAEAISTFVLPVTITNSNKNTAYSVGLSPFILYHFPISSNLDLYTGGIINLGFSNSNMIIGKSSSGVNYLQTDNTLTSQPATVNVGAGVLLGCQYFFYKNLALGVQAGIGAGYSIAKGNIVTINTVTNSGSDNPQTGSSSTTGPIPTENNHTFTFNTAASAGISLAFYFGRKAK